MKKANATIVLLGCACFLLLSTSIARAQEATPVKDPGSEVQQPAVVAQDAAATAKELGDEFQQSGALAQSEVEAIQAPLKNMIEKGATKEQLQGVITDLSNKEVKGEDLKKAVDSMNDLVNEGEEPKEAGSVVSAAAAQAHADGLKGKELAAKVHEAINQRKTKRLEAKGKEEKVEKAEKEVKVESEKVEKEVPQKGKGKGK